MIGLWYKDAVLYELDVKTYQDSNGDGIGDFPGLMRRLSYISGLGATCLWLRPFFSSPLRDDGYDITDYYAIDSRLGTLGDFVDFMTRANELGLRVLIDLVVNHTSIDHPWFQSARSDESSPYRDYYIWSQEKPRDLASHLAFPGEQESNWTYDEKAQAWYYHHFYWHQPDLNTENPAVRREIVRIIGFWLQLGVAGFRVDAVPFLLEHVERRGERTRVVEIADERSADAERAFELLREMRIALSWRRGDAVFLGEANVPVKLVPKFFGPGDDRMHMLFDFDLNANTFFALASQRAAPLLNEIQRVANIPAAGQWVNFLRNHDDLDLRMLTDRQRRDILEDFAPDDSMRIYGRAIRRRLAPMLAGDVRRIEMAHALMMSLPGTPLVHYGEEIGMGEDLSLPGRFALRTPMQWSCDRHAGFSSADSDKLIRPVVREGAFGYQRINVATQQKQPDSLLNRLERLIRVRRQCPEFGHGNTRALQLDHSAVVALRSEYHRGAVIAVHNLSDQEAAFKVPLNEAAGETLIDILGDPDGQSHVSPDMTLPDYGFRWMRVVGGGWESR